MDQSSNITDAMAEWRDFLSEHEAKELMWIDSTIEIARGDRKRLIDRCFARMARDKFRREGIRRIKDAMFGDAGETPSIKIDSFKFNAAGPIDSDADQ